MGLGRPNDWGPLKGRYETPRPRRMLALDGGGLRGLITLQVLFELERQLAEHYDRPELRLCEFFDYVGGTSTGAIIAAGLARGMRVQQICDFYHEFGKKAFDRRYWKAWLSMYKDGAIETKLKEVFGATTTLEPESLKTLLLVVTRNDTTDSAWPISSNPDAKYNDPGRPDCNLRIPLWKLVRASTAAPVYFPPEVIEWAPGDASKSFVFVDGGTTAYNNPAFLLSRMATEPAYRLGWESGERNLLVVSIGTGRAPSLGADAFDPEKNVVKAAVDTLSALMNQAAYDQDVNARTVGRCTAGGHVDGEVGDLVPRDADGVPIPLDVDLGRAFLYARYDAQLTSEWLSAHGLSDIAPDDVKSLDSVDAMDDLVRVGQALAKDVDLKDLGGFVDVPLYRGS